jgi:hypothetical protein
MFTLEIDGAAENHHVPTPSCGRQHFDRVYVHSPDSGSKSSRDTGEGKVA